MQGTHDLTRYILHLYPHCCSFYLLGYQYQVFISWITVFGSMVVVEFHLRLCLVQVDILTDCVYMFVDLCLYCSSFSFGQSFHIT
jgi:hypothetical protein